jgi:predicted RNA-binding Zn ribbon-like protein
MRVAPIPLSADPDLPFKYIGGNPSLDLVNTVDWTPKGLEYERLTDYERLIRWTEGAGIVSGQDAERLRRAGAERPDEARAAYDAARWLRWVLQRLFADIAAGERSSAALDDFNDLLAEALQRLRIAPLSEGKVAEWDWQGRGKDLESILWPIAWAAAALLTSEEANLVRVCAGPDCGWMYVDRSRNGLRRWCQMETCGTREKSRRRSRTRT